MTDQGEFENSSRSATSNARQGTAQAAARIAGSVVAPATLLGALMYFFGRVHATAFFAYFGVHFTVLDLSTLDFLVRSQDGLFIPIVVAGVGVLFGLWANRIVYRRLPSRVRRRLLLGSEVLALVGGLIGIAAACAGFIDPGAFASPVVAPGLGMAFGVILLAYAARPRRRGSAAVGVVAVEWLALYVLVGIGLFWSVANYSAYLGDSRAREYESLLTTRPHVAVLSDKGLALKGVATTKCADGASVRYDGLILILQAGGRYLLLPEDWSRRHGPAILLTRSDSIVLEFRTSATSEQRPSC